MAGITSRIGVGEGYALAFGFTWHMVDPLLSDSSRAEAYMNDGMKWMAKVRLDGSEFVGVSKLDFPPIKGIRTLSGAGQVAIHPQLAGRTLLVVLEEHGDTEDDAAVAVVGLLNGNIIVDDCVPLEQFEALQNAFEEACAKAGKGYSIVGNSTALAAVVEDYSWADFRPLRGKSFKGIQNRGREVRIEILRAPVPWLAVCSVSAVAIALICYWFYMDYQEELQQQADRVRREKLNDGPRRYEKSLAEHLAAPVLPANTAFSQLRASMSAFPIEFKRWDLSEIACGKTGVCVATWRNDEKVANYRDFVEAAPKEWGKVELKVNGVELTHALPVKLSLRALPPKEKWLDQRTFLLRQFSQWQQYWILSFKPQVMEPDVVAIPDGMPKSQAASLPSAAWAMGWSIPSTPWHLSEGFDRSPEKAENNLPDSVTVESLTITFSKKDRQINFKADGKIYVRI